MCECRCIAHDLVNGHVFHRYWPSNADMHDWHGVPACLHQLQCARGSVTKHGWPYEHLANLNKFDPVLSQTTGTIDIVHATCKA
eukprot:5955623-Pyramimonas_sp.AAC.1